MSVVSTILLTIFLFLQSIGVRADVPVNFQQDNWKEVSLGKDADNTFSYGDKLIVTVKKSSSPTVFKFDDVQEIETIEFDIAIQGEMQPEKKPIENFEEDSYLQFGFIVVGDNHLGAMGKLFAPKWVKELFGFAPEGKGLDKVYFYNIGQQKSLVDKERQNPKSKYMYEKIIFTKEDTGKALTYKLPKKLKTAALWVGAEGDASGSEFTTTINKIILK